MAEIVPNVTFNAYGLRLRLTPANPTFEEHTKDYALNLKVEPIRVELERAFRQLSKELLSGAIPSYFDDDRELRTVLNLGNDRQLLLTNWMLDPNNAARNAILVKLYEPLPAGVSVKDQLWISREITPPLLDQLSVVTRPTPLIPIYLRPKNEGITLFAGHEVNQTSLNTLFPSGAVNIPANWPTSSNVTLQESALERLYSIDAGSAELNIDYGAWSNFVHFSSAEKRLTIFKEKLVQIEALTTAINNQITYASGAYSASAAAGETPVPLDSMSIFPQLRTNMEERQSIIRSFDGYEKFLYYETGSFSASLSGDDDEDLILYQPTASWPKDGNLNILPTTNSVAMTWFTTQSVLAQDYDGQNQNWLVRVVPNYLQDDIDSDAYLTFVNMVGHHFDLIKNYADQMTQIYDRDPSPDRGLSKDLIWHIGSSLGIEFPHLSSILSAAGLTDWAQLASSASFIDTYRDATTEAWKRYLHSSIYLMKTKGTDEAYNTLFKIYGLPYETIRLKTSMKPSTVYMLNPLDPDVSSYEKFDEGNYVLPFTNGTHLVVPFSSSLLIPRTIEMRFSLSGSASGTLLSAGTDGSDPDWTIEVIPETVTSSWTSREDVKKAKFVVKDGAGQWAATTATDTVFNNGYYTLMLRESASSYDFTVARYASERFTYLSGPHAITTGSFTGSWSAADVLFVGGSGSSYMTGSVDELRVWSEPISLRTFRTHVKFPGAYAGETTSSAREQLIWRHSFNKPQNMATTASYPNESPLLAQYTGSAVMSASVAVGFSGSLTFPHAFLKVRRETQRYSPNAGGYVYSTNRVTIAPTASLTLIPARMTQAGVPVLSRTSTLRTYSAERKAANRLALYASLAETLNDSILRSVGTAFNLHDLIGDPLNSSRDSYPELDALNAYYAANYRPASMSYQTLARNVDGVLDGVFKAAGAITPASARLLTGLVIEPTILERSKQRAYKKLAADGPMRANLVSASILLASSGSLPSTWNLEASMSLPPSGSGLDASLGFLSTDVTADPAPSASADWALYQDANPLHPTASLSMSADFAFWSSSLAIAPTASLTALYLTYSASIAATASTWTGSLVGGAAHDLDGGAFIMSVAQPMDLYPYGYWKAGEIAPRPDRFTYFTHISGTFGVRRLERQRVGSKTLSNKGAWVQGTEYKVGDVVTQYNQTGSANWGNGVEFRCLTSKVLVTSGTVNTQRQANFVSQKPPAVDPDNWSRVRYELREAVRPWVAVQSGTALHANDLKKATLIPYTQWSASHASWSIWSQSLDNVSLQRTTEGLIAYDDFNRALGSLDGSSPNFATASAAGQLTWSVNADSPDGINITSSDAGTFVTSDSGTFNHKASLSSSTTAFTGAFASGVLVGMNVSARAFGATEIPAASTMSRTTVGLIIFDDFNRANVWDAAQPWLDTYNKGNATTASIAGSPPYVQETGGTNAAESSIYQLIDPTEEYIVQSNSRWQSQMIFGKTSGSVSASAGVPQEANFINLSGGAGSSSGSSAFYLEGNPGLNNWGFFHRVNASNTQVTTIGGHGVDTVYNTTRIVFRRGDADNLSGSIYAGPDSTLPNVMSASFATSASWVRDVSSMTTASTFYSGTDGSSAKEMVGMGWGNRDGGAARHAMFVVCGVDITINGIHANYTASLISGSTTVTSSTAHGSTLVMPADGIPLPLTKIEIYKDTGTQLTESTHASGIWGGDVFTVNDYIYTIHEGTTGLIFRDDFDRADSATVGYGWTEADTSFEISASTMHDGDGVFVNNGNACYQNAAEMTGSPSGNFTARHGFALQSAGRIGATGNFVGIGMFGTAGADTSIYVGIGDVNHLEVTRRVAGSNTDQDTDSTITGSVDNWYGFRMTVAPTGSNVNVRGLIVPTYLSASNTLDQAFEQHVEITDVDFASGDDLFGAVKYRDASWDEVILFGNGATSGAIEVYGVPNNYQIQIDNHTAVVASNDTASIPMSTWETWAFPATTVSLLDAADEVISTWYSDPASGSGIWGGHIFSMSAELGTGVPGTSSFLPGVGFGKERGETHMDTAGSDWYFTSHSAAQNLTLNLRHGATSETLITSAGTFAPQTWHAVRMAYQQSGSAGTASVLSLYAFTEISSSEPSQSAAPESMSLLGSKILESESIAAPNLSSVGMHLPGMAQLGDQFYACGRYIFVGGLPDNWTASISYNELAIVSSSYGSGQSASLNMDYMPLPYHTLSIYNAAGVLQRSFYPSWSLATPVTGGFGGDYYLFATASAVEPATYSLVHEYTEHHYRYFRDTTTPYNRIRYDGCLQTIDTTIDGGPAAESNLSSEAQLIVQDGTPVRRDKDEKGPILDVE